MIVLMSFKAAWWQWKTAINPQTKRFQITQESYLDIYSTYHSTWTYTRLTWKKLPRILPMYCLSTSISDEPQAPASTMVISTPFMATQTLESVKWGHRTLSHTDLTLISYAPQSRQSVMQRALAQNAQNSMRPQYPHHTGRHNENILHFGPLSWFPLGPRWQCERVGVELISHTTA